MKFLKKHQINSTYKFPSLETCLPLGVGLRVSLRARSFLIIVFSFLFTLPACTQDKVESKVYEVMLNSLISHTVPEIFVRDFSPEPEMIFLDAREINEYAVSHFENAVWVGYNDFELSRVEGIEKDEQIIVYCSVGYRSEKVSEKLIEAGYTNVSNLYGGIFEWRNQDNEIVNPNGEKTDSIHAFDKTWGIWLKEGIKVYD